MIHAMLEYQLNSSLQGNLEKTWIIDNGERKLVKGNHDIYSSESINEVLISEVILAQGRECVKYSLIHIAEKNMTMVVYLHYIRNTNDAREMYDMAFSLL